MHGFGCGGWPRRDSRARPGPCVRIGRVRRRGYEGTNEYVFSVQALPGFAGLRQTRDADWEPRPVGWSFDLPTAERTDAPGRNGCKSGIELPNGDPPPVVVGRFRSRTAWDLPSAAARRPIGNFVRFGATTLVRRHACDRDPASNRGSSGNRAGRDDGGMSDHDAATDRTGCQSASRRFDQARPAVCDRHPCRISRP
jgi:hypothetical protein